MNGVNKNIVLKHFQLFKNVSPKVLVEENNTSISPNTMNSNHIFKNNILTIFHCKCENSNYTQLESQRIAKEPFYCTKGDEFNL